MLFIKTYTATGKNCILISQNQFQAEKIIIFIILIWRREKGRISIFIGNIELDITRAKSVHACIILRWMNKLHTFHFYYIIIRCSQLFRAAFFHLSHTYCICAFLRIGKACLQVVAVSGLKIIGNLKVFVSLSIVVQGKLFFLCAVQGAHGITFPLGWEAILPAYCWLKTEPYRFSLMNLCIIRFVQFHRSDSIFCRENAFSSFILRQAVTAYEAIRFRCKTIFCHDVPYIFCSFCISKILCGFIILRLCQTLISGPAIRFCHFLCTDAEHSGRLHRRNCQKRCHDPGNFSFHHELPPS